MDTYTRQLVTATWLQEGRSYNRERRPVAPGNRWLRAGMQLAGGCPLAAARLLGVSMRRVIYAASRSGVPLASKSRTPQRVVIPAAYTQPVVTDWAAVAAAWNQCPPGPGAPGEMVGGPPRQQFATKNSSVTGNSHGHKI